MAQETSEKTFTLKEAMQISFDAFNQAHYSHMHPDVVPPVEHMEWTRRYFLDKFNIDISNHHP